MLMIPTIAPLSIVDDQDLDNLEFNLVEAGLSVSLIDKLVEYVEEGVFCFSGQACGAWGEAADLCWQNTNDEIGAWRAANAIAEELGLTKSQAVKFVHIGDKAILDALGCLASHQEALYAALDCWSETEEYFHRLH